MNKIIIALMIIALVFLSGSVNRRAYGSFGANAESGIQTSFAGRNKNIKLVKKADRAQYLLRNGIKEDYKHLSVDTSKGTLQLDVFQLSGLQDKSIEQRVNKSIEASVVQEVKNYVKETPDTPYYTLTTKALLDVNNLLSISIIEYRAEDSFQIYGMLYSLTDGKRLSLRDIFTQGTDYVSLLNQKITENLIGGENSEEEVLREPFTSIKDNQNFVLTPSELYVIFLKGESGFQSRTAIKIPLTKLDDYVDILDRYFAAGKIDYQFAGLIVKMNNIFVQIKTDSSKLDNGTIYIQYPEISGIRDTEFENQLNNTIKNDAYDALKNKIPKNISSPGYDSSNMPIGSIIMNAVFNHYGILTIERRVNFPGCEMTDGLLKVYSFDLKDKKPIDTVKLLDNYIKKHPETENSFVTAVKEKVIQLCRERNINLSGSIDSIFDYTFIKQHSIVYFSKYLDNDWIFINVLFDSNIFKDVPAAIECNLNFKDIIKTNPEDFFGQ